MSADEPARRDPPPGDNAETLEISHPAALSHPVPAEPGEGQRVGPYQILREIGRGGMGVVYLAVRADDEYRKRVAIKLIPAGMDAAFILSRFRRERQILATLEHPNICRLLDGGTTSGNRPYFVMEFIEGEPIDQYAARRSLTVPERLELFRQVCSAVQYAHQNLVVHRDLKPGNILVTEAGVAKLLDFGIAKLMNPELYPDAMAQTVAVVRAMTPDYASPEQVRGGPVTTSSDVYSLGVLLYELLTGHLPYRLKPASTLQDRERAICEQDPERPSRVITRPEGSRDVEPPEKLRRRLAGDLDNIVLMALRKEPQRRYASVEQFSEDIRRHLEGLPVIARKPTAGYLSAKFLSRHKTGAAAALLVAVTLAGGVTATVREARIAERRFNDVRKLANSVVFELHDAIRDLPGSTSARKLLVQRALEYLDRLAQEGSGDRDLQLELAAAYQKIGDVQGNAFQANLGDSPGAAASYRKALAIREKLAASAPGDARAQSALAASYAGLGDLEYSRSRAGSLDYYRKAAAIQTTLRNAHPDDNRAGEELAASLSRVGEIQGLTGDSSGGLATYNQAVALFEQILQTEPQNRKALGGLATTYNLIGIAHRGASHPKEALTPFEKAKEIRERLAAADPGNASAQRSLWVSLNSVGDVLGNPGLENLGRPAEALAHYRRALAIAESLAASDPKNVRARRDVKVSLTRIGDILKGNGDLAGAAASYRKALAVNEELRAANPQNSEHRRDQAIDLDRLASTLARSGDTPGALAAHNQALAVSRQLMLDDPKNTNLRLDWLISVDHTGTLLMKTGNLAAALELFRPGLEQAGKLVELEPAKPSFIRALIALAELSGDAHHALAIARGVPPSERTAHHREAERCFGIAMEQWTKIQQQGSLSSSDEKALGDLSRKRAGTSRLLAAR